MVKTLISLIAAAALVVTACAGGKKYADVSHQELKQAISSGAVTLIDVNGSSSYENGHIPGAMDFEAVKADLAAKLPKDKNALIVAYCGGPMCGAYKKAADAAVALGYTNVKHYSGGISGWEEKGEKMAKTKS